MNQDRYDLVKGSMARRRKAAATVLDASAPTQEEIDSLLAERITPDTDLPPMMPLFRMFDVPCFYRGELVADCGKAKSGKTFFLSILMAAALTGKALALERTEYPTDTDPKSPEGIKPLKVLWIDTEQSQQSTQEILRDRIIPLAEKGRPDDMASDDMNSSPGVPENVAGPGEGGEGRASPSATVKSLCDTSFYAFNLRGLGFEKRSRMVEVAIRTLSPDIVIVDGVKDLITDINDAVQATFIMEKMMALAKEKNCCIVCVLHQNKSEADRNMRGSIGTELTNKAFEVYQCEMIEESETFKVTHTYSRKQKMKRKLYYRISDDGLPDECADFQERLRDEQGRFMSAKARHTVTPDVKWESFNQHYIVHEEGGTYHWDLRSLFEDAMEGRSARPYRHFMAASLKLSHIVDANYFYQLVKEGENMKIISKILHPDTSETWVELKENTLPF